MTRLTIAKIETTKPPTDGSELKLWDGAVAGLYLRVFSSGGRSWVYRYRADGGGRGAKVRTLKLGSYPTLSLDAAREAARAHAGLLAKGQDPAGMRQEKRRREAASLSRLLAVDGPYERHLKERRLVKVKDVLSSLRRGLRHLTGSDIDGLRRRDLLEAFDRLKDLPGAQAELRTHTRALLEWAVNADLIRANVLAGLRLPPKTRAQRLTEEARRRALTNSDIVALWPVATTQFGAAVRLALLTAMRRGELAALRWSDIGADRITLCASVTKTGAQHEIPLTGLMREVLAARPRTASELVFPAARTGRTMTTWGVAKPPLVAAAGIGPWTLHDLRRTCRTLMSRLGVPEPAAELAIGHVKASLVSIYNRDQQWQARVDAFARVSQHITRLVGGGDLTDP